jgi:hypothetical protein
MMGSIKAATLVSDGLKMGCVHARERTPKSHKTYEVQGCIARKILRYSVDQWCNVEIMRGAA